MTGHEGGRGARPALRDGVLLDALTASPAPASTLDESADGLDRIAPMLEPHAVPSRYTGHRRAPRRDPAP